MRRAFRIGPVYIVWLIHQTFPHLGRGSESVHSYLELHHHERIPTESLRKPYFPRLCLRGGECTLSVPDDMPTMDKAVKYMESEEIKQFRISFKAGEHQIGAEEYDHLAIRFDDEAIDMTVEGQKGAELSGHWKLTAGKGHFRNACLVDLVKLAPDGLMIDRLGDNCIMAEGGSWTFQDCEIHSSGTAVRAAEEATVLLERCTSGGFERAKMPSSNYSTWKIPDFLIEALDGLMHREPKTGRPYYPEAESSMPRYAVTAWGRAQVTLRGCTIINMTYNGVCCTDSSTVVLEDCGIYGCRMAAVYMEGDGSATLRRCVFENNFVGVSVWGGFGEERLFKTVSSMEPEEDVLVCPNCSMVLDGNRFVGRAWAGDLRPARLVEEGAPNVYTEGADGDEELSHGDEGERGGGDVSGEEDDDGLLMVEDTPGQKVKLWKMEDPITIPSWAPQDRRGGDGVSEWTPFNETVAAGPPRRKRKAPPPPTTTTQPPASPLA